MKKNKSIKQVTNLFSKLPTNILKKIKKISQPSFIQPMLATLTKDYFSSKDWIYEHKFDGERCLAFKKNGKVKLKTRNKRIINNQYPEIVLALEKQKSDNFIIDGEIIALDKKNNSNFQLLQSRINLQNKVKIAKRKKSIKICYCIFDIMYLDQYDLRNLSLLYRKTILQGLLNYNNIIEYTTHQYPDGLKYFKKACKNGWEGLIAKEIQSTYVGIRSKNWLKFKCVSDQELIIIGYTDPKGSEPSIGALIVGYYKNKKLMYAGKVGTGFKISDRKMLKEKLYPLQIKKCIAENYNKITTKGIHWVEPKLVGEFKFAEWTKDNKLRVPRYQGLRFDKAAKDVVKEEPDLS